MIARTADPALVNGYANHPAVRPHVGLQARGPLDFTGFLADPRNVALAVPGGCFLFEPAGTGRYEVHTLLTPGHRGAAVVPASRAAAAWMFDHAGCIEIITRLPVSNRAADLMVRRVGFRLLRTVAGVWEDGSDVRIFHLGAEDFRARFGSKEARLCPQL